jgi:hypothetical protein
VTVRLVTGTTSGLATITAYSGGASAQLKDLKVGSGPVKTIVVTSRPQQLGSSGGQAQIVANVIDADGTPVAGVLVTFATDRGSLSPPIALTDDGGFAVTTLTTTATAKVTATVGAVTSPATTVTVSAFGLASFTPDTPAGTAGSVISFTVSPAAGANLTNVRVDFGDGNTKNLGPISKDTKVPNTYCSPGSYNATATYTDAAGETGSLSAVVIIGALPVTITAEPPVPTVGAPVLFSVSLAASTQVSKFVWTFDDPPGPPETTTSAHIFHTFPSRGTKTVRVDVFGATGCQIGTSTFRLTVQ